MKNIERSSISPKSRNMNFYLEKIGIENILKIEVVSTAGDIRPPFPFQWRIVTIPFGDDGIEGFGETPLQAIRDLYKEMKVYLNEK